MLTKAKIAPALRIALAVETAGAAGRDMLRGIARYAREKTSWRLLHQPGSIEESIARVFREARRGHVDGIIMRIADARAEQQVARLRIPTVDVLGAAESALPLVHVDNAAIGKLAAQHLRERGFRAFGCCENTRLRRLYWSIERARAFELALQKTPLGVSRFEWKGGPDPRKAERDLKRLTSWIRSLPKPVGIFACSDILGRRVLDACRRAKLEVPDAVAVVGVDNDEILCELSAPALSSIDANHFGVGYEAAAMLDRMLKGGEPRSKRTLLEPVGLFPRGSTQKWAIDDQALSTVLSFIHERACAGVGVEDVVAQVGLSRRTLERRFQDRVGHSIYDEILRVRIQRVEQLLGGTDLPIKSIASEAGFSHPEHLSALFRARTGRTPREFRSEVRRAAPKVR